MDVMSWILCGVDGDLMKIFDSVCITPSLAVGDYANIIGTNDTRNE